MSRDHNARQRMEWLILALDGRHEFNPEAAPVTQREGEALLVLSERIVNSVPIRKVPGDLSGIDMEYVRLRLKCCGWLVGDAAEEGIREMVENA